jgi:zinc protease
VPTKASALPADLTAEKVIAKYIEAIGGEKKVKELKSCEDDMKATIQGQELRINDEFQLKKISWKEFN